jgi:hypothetical protein
MQGCRRDQESQKITRTNVIHRVNLACTAPSTTDMRRKVESWEERVGILTQILAWCAMILYVGWSKGHRADCFKYLFQNLI